jgi:hypothetical protein
VPPKADAEFVWRMEDVIQTYLLPYDPVYRVLCFDEACKQLFGEVRPFQPPGPGMRARLDYEYERKGVCHQLMMCEPLRGWRQVQVTKRRTRRDYAACVRELVDVHYPRAKQIRLVQDNLNTHDGASLYEAFSPEEARRILNKLEFHYTPKHGSWLNMAETEINIMNSQCLDRRLDSQSRLADEVSSYEKLFSYFYGIISCPHLPGLASAVPKYEGTGRFLIDNTRSFMKLHNKYPELWHYAIYRRFQSGNAEYSPKNIQTQSTLSCETAGSLHSPQLERVYNHTASRDFSSRSYYRLSLV